MYYKSKDIAIHHVLPLIQLRLQHLAERGLPPDGYLPFCDQKAIQVQLYRDWVDSEDGKVSATRIRPRTTNKTVGRWR